MKKLKCIIANMEIYDIHEYIKKISRAIIKIAIFKGIFKYETHIQT